jgi:hypothetical protein
MRVACPRGGRRRSRRTRTRRRRRSPRARLPKPPTARAERRRRLKRNLLIGAACTLVALALLAAFIVWLSIGLGDLAETVGGSLPTPTPG